MNPFDKFGIKYLSPSSLNTWRECPGLWALKYLGKFRDDAGPAAWRGNAVEKGLLTWFLKKDRDAALEQSLSVFDGEALGEIRDDIQAERTIIEPMLDMAIKESERIPAKLLGSQTRVELSVPGLSVAIIGYADFLFEDGGIVDLKTTKRLPSSPKPDHARQVALYSTARNAPASLLYVTDKRAATYPIGDNEREHLIAEMSRDAMSLQSFLNAQPDAATAIRCLPMQSDSFRWSQAATAKLQEYV